MYKDLTSCRVCGSDKLHLYLDLGTTPLANSLVTEPGQKESFFPLKVLCCEECSLSQLSIVVDPEVMFRDYVYRSAVSQTFKDHCDELAAAATTFAKVEPGKLVVDIASNDGTLLKPFKSRGYQVLGIDPAQNLAKLASEDGIPTIPEFFGPDVGRKVAAEYGKASVITATNVFAHVDDVKGFMEGVQEMLDDKGVFIIECPYAVDFIENNEFDTVYHEHLSYFLLRPITILAEKYGLEVAKVDHIPIHGGTISVYIKKKANEDIPVHESVAQTLAKEEQGGYYTRAPYEDFSRRAEGIKAELADLVDGLIAQGKKVIGYGASAKGSTLLNYCGIGADKIAYIIDDTPEKQNKKTAGQHIPIMSRESAENEPCDYVLILPWNFKDEIMRKAEFVRKAGGKFIVPIPQVSVV